MSDSTIFHDATLNDLSGSDLLPLTPRETPVPPINPQLEKAIQKPPQPSKESTSRKATAPPRSPAKGSPASPPEPVQDAVSDPVAQADEELGEEHDSDEQGAARAFFYGLPSWLISLIVHTIALLVLAMLTFSSSPPKQRLSISSTPSDSEELDNANLETISFELENIEMESVALSEAPGAANLGETLAPDIVTEVSSVGSLNIDDATVDIGMMFGNEGQGFADMNDGLGGADFFGVTSAGRKFVFIVDGSRSMRGKKKWEYCQEELLYAIRQLSPRQYFYVMLFADKSYRMFGDEPEPAAVPATVENIQRLQQWLYDYELQLQTKPEESVRFAREVLVPDAIYLLTDGAFTGNDQTRRYLRENNFFDDPIDGRTPIVIVHTIGFFSNKGLDQLEQIAEENGGTYRYVPPPN